LDTVLSEDKRTLRETTTTIDLPRFGDCSYTESEVVRFPWGLPGFAALRRFLVISVEEEQGYIWLQSLDDHSVAIPLCDPWSLFEEYEAPLPLYAKESLGIENAESFCVMCVLVARPGAETTINLLAPIFINLKTRVGRQVTLENQRYSVRTPVQSQRSGLERSHLEVLPSNG
jgi:flagellar assembly factor FliW